MTSADQSPRAVSVHVPKPREDRLTLGVLLMAIAFLAFTFLDASAKWLVGVGLPVMQVVFVRYLGHFLFSVAVYLPMEGPRIFRSNAVGLQLLRALFLFSGTTLNFIALKYLPLTVTIAIFFASPILVCLLAVPILGERIGIRRFAAIVVGFVGVLVVVQPGGTAFSWPMLSSLGALTCAAMYFIFSRKVAGVDDNSTGQIYTAGTATVLLAPFALMDWVWPSTFVNWGFVIIIGLLGAVGHSTLTVAYRFASAPTLAPMVYTQVIYATALSWLLFGQPPDFWTGLGTTIIIGSGLYIWLREHQIRSRVAGITR